MKDFRAWVAAIRREIDDDTVRLACADWLDERDQPQRAEFIRVQCELARIAGDDPRRPELWQREQELLAEYQDEWIANELPAWARSRVEFRRGFVEHVSGVVSKLATRTAGLLARSPVTSIRATRAYPADIERLAACSHLIGLRELHLYDPSPESIAPLLAAPFLPSLRGLHLSAWSHSMNVNRVAALLESPVCSQLTRLTLDSFALDVPGIRRLAGSEIAGRLAYLRLDVMGDDDVRVLANGTRFPHLDTLDLDEDVLLSDVAIQTLAGSMSFDRLTRLSLRALHHVTDAGIRSLAESKSLKNLTDLNLCATGVTSEGIRALIESPNLPRLSRIDVSHSKELAQHFPLRLWKRPAKTAFCTLWVRDVRTPVSRGEVSVRRRSGKPGRA